MYYSVLLEPVLVSFDCINIDKHERYHQGDILQPKRLFQYVLRHQIYPIPC